MVSSYSPIKPGTPVIVTFEDDGEVDATFGGRLVEKFNRANRPVYVPMPKGDCYVVTQHGVEIVPLSTVTVAVRKRR